MPQNVQPIRIQKGCSIHDSISPNLKPSCAASIVLPNVFSMAWYKIFIFLWYITCKKISEYFDFWQKVSEILSVQNIYSAV